MRWSSLGMVPLWYQQWLLWSWNKLLLKGFLKLLCQAWICSSWLRRTMSIYSPHSPYHHPVPSMLQTPGKVDTRSRDQLNQAPFVQLCPSELIHASSSWGLQQLEGSIPFLTTQTCKAAEIMLYPGLWGVSWRDYGSSWPLINLYTFSICPRCLLFSVPPLQALFSRGSQPLAAFPKPTPTCFHPQNGNHSLISWGKTHSSPCSSTTRSNLDKIIGFFSSFSILERLILYH